MKKIYNKASEYLLAFIYLKTWWLSKMSKKQSHYIQLDLIILLLALMVVSILAIYNAQQLGQYEHEGNFAIKQIIYFAMGVILVVALQFIDLEQLYKSSLYLYIFGVLLVVILHFSPHSIARPVNGSKSWFNEIPFITIQPSEVTKIVFILFLAAIIVKHKEKFVDSTLNSDLWLITKLLLTTILPIAFILKQPDLGTSVVFLFITGVLIILSGIDWKILLTLIVGGVATIVLSVLLIVNFPELSQTVLGIKSYQIERIMTWFDPTQQVSDDRYQIDRSLLTIGSGQLTGKGMNSAEVALPEAHTDFIFSIIGESFGFMALILVHTFQNIGMTIGIMPITGIPLLFISYGGSTTLSTMIGFGIVYRVAVEQSRQRDFLFN